MPLPHRLSPVPPPDASGSLVDLAAFTNGGLALAYSDAHYGRAQNLIAPGRAKNMGEGWETARKPDRPPVLEASSDSKYLKLPATMCDWAIIQLGVRQLIYLIVYYSVCGATHMYTEK